ncbi:sigma-70 family RNA polymerase sigma factor [Anaeromyxobacter diazotrophicus]|nr:sigma-70 family RNA polymerase sigma factor [Anaeromyxobacter diazotrophicus]
MALGTCDGAIPAEGWRTVREEPVELTLVRQAVRGDRAAFARLVDLYQRAVFGLCCRLVQDREEARDAAQETFVRAYAALATYDAANPFGPWLLRIARNHCIDLVRRRLPPARRLELDAPVGGGREDGSELPDAAVRPADEQLVEAQQASAVGAAVAALPHNYREVIHLFHVEHMSYKEIAATLEVPIGTVMTWLHRARARLRERMAEEEREP